MPWNIALACGYAKWLIEAIEDGDDIRAYGLARLIARYAWS